MLKPTVLIVDDEKPTREGLRAALEDRYDVYIAEDGEGALRLLEEDGYDVLLTDLRMPGIGGLDLIKRAKSLGKPPICILMTAYGSEEMAVDAMRQGADDTSPRVDCRLMNSKCALRAPCVRRSWNPKTASCVRRWIPSSVSKT